MKPFRYFRSVLIYEGMPKDMQAKYAESLTRDMAFAIGKGIIDAGKVEPVTLDVTWLPGEKNAQVEIERVVYILTPDEYDTVCKEWKARGQSEVIAESYDLGFAAGRAIGYSEGRGLIEMGTRDEPDQD